MNRHNRLIVGQRRLENTGLRIEQVHQKCFVCFGGVRVKNDNLNGFSRLTGIERQGSGLLLVIGNAVRVLIRSGEIDRDHRGEGLIQGYCKSCSSSIFIDCDVVDGKRWLIGVRDGNFSLSIRKDDIEAVYLEVTQVDQEGFIGFDEVRIDDGDGDRL